MKTRDGIQTVPRTHPGDSTILAVLGLAILVAAFLEPARAVGEPLFAASYMAIPAIGYGKPALVDVNRDGLLDIIGAGVVMLGSGDGSFRPGTPVETGVRRGNSRVADLNNDGNLDLVTPSYGWYYVGDGPGSTVAVVLGNGDGTFGAPTEFTTGLSPTTIVVGDLNGDGNADLVTSNGGPPSNNFPKGNSISVLLGDGDGTFRLKTDYITGEGPREIAIADVNRDGRQDVVTCNAGTYESAGNTISILFGTGDGTLEPKRDIVTGSRPSSVAVDDLNADGIMDLAVIGSIGPIRTDYSNEGFMGSSSVHLGNGDGTFRDRAEYEGRSSSYYGGVASDIVITDLNADGRQDMVDCHSIRLGNGDGSFGPRIDVPIGGAAGVATGDVNQDGRMDVLVGTTLLLGNGDGTFGSPSLTYAFTTGVEAPHSVATGDLNHDGHADLVIPNYDYEGTLSVMLGNGDGTFQPDRAHVVVEPGNTSAALADFNRDGHLDVVVAGEYEKIAILFGRGDGTFASMIRVDPGSRYLNDNRFVSVDDLNADEQMDVVVRGSGRVVVLLGDGTGTFEPRNEYEVAGSSGSVAIGDLNGDGAKDLVTASVAAQSISVLLGNGDGTFQSRRDLDSPNYPESVSIADLNADGRKDLVTAGSWGLEVLLGDGNGSFGPPTTMYAVGGYGNNTLWRVQLAAVGDLNADGKPDIVGAGWPGFAVLLGNGDGTFQGMTMYGGPPNTTVAIEDLNGDGRPDLVGVGTVMLNIGAGRPLSMGLELRPRTINRGAHRQWITAMLEMPASHEASAIEVSSLHMNGIAIPAAKQAVTVDGSGRKLLVRFEWEAANAALGSGSEVPVTITGTLGGRPFTASDVIRVIEGIAVTAVPSPESGHTAMFALRPMGARFAGAPTVRYSLSGSAAAVLEVFDVHGRRVDHRNVTSAPGWHSTQLRDLPAGVYLMRLRQADRSATSRLVVIH